MPIDSQGFMPSWQSNSLPLKITSLCLSNGKHQCLCAMNKCFIFSLFIAENTENFYSQDVIKSIFRDWKGRIGMGIIFFSFPSSVRYFVLLSCNILLFRWVMWCSIMFHIFMCTFSTLLSHKAHKRSLVILEEQTKYIWHHHIYTWVYNKKIESIRLVLYCKLNARTRKYTNNT